MTVHNQFIFDVLELSHCGLVNVILVDFMPTSGAAWFDIGLKYFVFRGGGLYFLECDCIRYRGL